MGNIPKTKNLDEKIYYNFIRKVEETEYPGLDLWIY